MGLNYACLSHATAKAESGSERLRVKWVFRTQLPKLAGRRRPGPTCRRPQPTGIKQLGLRSWDSF
jgi:hypothetical protein